jgi:hypothetical protein
VGADAARVGDDPDPPAGWRRHLQEHRGLLHELVVVADPDHPKLAKEGVLDFVAAGQGGSVGAGGSLPDLALPDLEDDQRLLAAQRLLGQPP